MNGVTIQTTQPEAALQSPGASRTVIGRRPIPLLRFPLVIVSSVVYAILASMNPVLSQSAVAVGLISMLFVIVTLFILMGPNGDTLDPFRVMSVYYLMCFCIAPLFVIDPYWHFSAPLGDLAAKSAAFLIAGYLMTAVGYYLPIFRSIPDRIEIGPMRASPSMIRFFALILFVIGQLSLLVLFVRAGGLGTILGSEEAKNSFLRGHGIFFWLALASFSGGVLYFAAHAKPNVRLSWLRSWPLWITAMSWVIFQSRMKVLNVLVMGLLVSHYLLRPMRMSRVAIFGVAGFVFVVAVGFARNTNNRYLLLTNPAALGSALGDHFWGLSNAVMVGSFSRLRQIMLIFDKVPSITPHDWGASFLMVFNPFLRLAGFGEHAAAGIGPRLFELAHPELKVELDTGYLSSLPGEFLFNFPWYLAIFVFPLYGMALRSIYSRLVLRNANPCSIALYAILLLALVNMIFASFGQNLFELLVLCIPPFVAIKLSEMASGGGARTAPVRTTASAPS